MFQPKRKNQLHCSPECRRRAHREKLDAQLRLEEGGRLLREAARLIRKRKRPGADNEEIEACAMALEAMNEH